MQPFTGIEVVEFGQFIAVPFCAQLLAEGGAHVIKVESLDGDPVRHLAQLAPGETRHFISRNRGKHSLPLDLKQPAARPVINALLTKADVVLMMAALLLQNNVMTRIETGDSATHADILAQLASLRQSGVPHTEQAALIPQVRVPGMVNVYYRTYQTKDSAMAIACVSRGL